LPFFDELELELFEEFELELLDEFELELLDKFELELLDVLELELLEEFELELPAEAGTATPAATTSPQAPSAVYVFQRFGCLPRVADVPITDLQWIGYATDQSFPVPLRAA
jgi:hypothetical protein